MDINSGQENELTLISTLLIIGLCVLFGSNVIAIKYSISGLGVYFTASIRFLLASLCLLIWAAFTRQKIGVEKGKWLPLAIISLTFSLQLILIYTGISKTTASRSSLITNLQPFFVLFLAHFFIPGDRINLKKVIGISMAFTGLAFIFMDNSASDSNVRTGDLLILGGAFVWACNAVYTKRIIAQYEPIQITLYPMILSIPIAFVASLIFDSEQVRFVDTAIIASLAYQSVLAAAFGYVAWNSMLKRYGAVTLHSFVFIMPIAGVLLGGLILGELITSRLLAGMIFVVLGLLATHLKQKTVRPISTISRNV